MPTQTQPIYYCGNENRRQMVRATMGPGDLPLLNGIDYLEISELDQRVLEIHFIHPLPGEANEVPVGQPALDISHFEILGGERITGIRVVSVSSNGLRLRIVTDVPGDFSIYTLCLVMAAGMTEPPPGFDPRLSRLEFSFKAACPSPFDCRDQNECDKTLPENPRIDYLARDYQSFRRVMLDRLRLLLPNYTESSPADFPIAMTELLAYVGDQMAYAQDANATEAYLGTARQRISVKRHARLRDYWMHEGCNARAWVHCTIEPASDTDGRVLQAGMGFFVGSNEQLKLARQGAIKQLKLDEVLIFEAMAPVTVRAAHNRFEFYTWSDTECSLCKGAQKATLRRPVGAALTAGAVLIFEEVLDPTAPEGSTTGGRPDWRWPVRLTHVEATLDILTGDPIYEIAWAEADALPFSFIISRRVDDVLIENITLATGNIILVDNGLSFVDTDESPGLLTDQAPFDGGVYRPMLQRSHLTYSQELQNPIQSAAARCMQQDPAQATPQLRLESNGESWRAVGDLLGSDDSSAEFVVEMDNERRPHLRFGDGLQGRAPTPGQTFRSRFRIGNGIHGNVGADTIRATTSNLQGILKVRNPLTAVGGADPESIEQVKQFAPVAFRTQNRAVTLEDYEVMAARFPGVQKAKAEFRWLAAWYTVMIAVDRKDGLPVDAEFRTGLLAHMERYRMTGYDLDIREPVYVPMEIIVEACLKPSANQSTVLRELQARLGSGSNGLFHPENLSFGDRIYSSRIIALTMEVTGVDHARMRRFKRFREPPNNELAQGFIEVSGLELPQLANDPSFPERGTIEFILKGGS